MFAAWQGRAGRSISAEAAVALTAAGAAWRSGVIQPIRKARRAAKEERSDLARRFMEIEIEAEQQNLEVLCGLAELIASALRASRPIEANLEARLPAAARGAASARQLVGLLCA